MVYVKDQLGHGSIRVTVDTYGHLVPGENKSAVDELDEDSYMSELFNANGTIKSIEDEKKK